jgi:hypothetical protein
VTARAYGIKAFGNLETCELCAISKKKQKKKKIYGLDQVIFQESNAMLILAW